MTWFKCIGQDGGGGGGGDTIKFLGSNKNQWIALPLYSDDYPVIKTKIMTTELLGQQALIGDLWDVSSFMLYSEGDNNLAFRYTTGNVDNIPSKPYKWVDLELDYTAGTCKYDGITYGGIQKTQLHNQIYLFGLSNYQLSYCALSDIQIYKNGNLYMNLVPMDDSNGGYYYDTVGQQSYRSASSTPLIYNDMDANLMQDITYIFKDGQWLNRDKIAITPYLSSIQNNKLVFSGENAGIIVSQVNLSNAYVVMFEAEVDTAQNVGIQAGRCNPTTDISTIINTGQGRLSYTDDTLVTNSTTFVEIKTNGSSEGIFFGGGYQQQNISYKINAIWYKEITTLKLYN